MLFTEFSTYLHELEQTTKRNQMVEILSQLFKIITPEEIEKAIYLLQGRLAPAFLPLEIGDLGDVAEKHISSLINQMSVLDVYNSLYQRCV